MSIKEQELKSKVSHSTISVLPLEMLEFIFQNLDTTGLLCGRAVSKLWCTSCTKECRKRPISLKSIKSQAQFEVFIQAFGNQHITIPPPWSSYKFCYGYTNKLQYVNTFVQKFGRYLNTISIYQDDFSYLSISEFCGHFPNVSRLEFPQTLQLNKTCRLNCDFNALYMPKLTEISITLDATLSVDTDSILYLFVKHLCKRLKQIELLIVDLIDLSSARSYASIFSEIGTVFLRTSMCDPIACQVLIDGQLRLTRLALDMHFGKSWDQLAYEHCLMSAAIKLNQLHLHIMDDVKNQKPFEFPCSPYVAYLLIMFHNGWCWENLENKEVGSYISTLTPSKFPALKTLILGCSQEKKREIFNRVALLNQEYKFPTVDFVHVKGFELNTTMSKQLQLNFPSALIIEG